MTEGRKAWITPELIVLVRSKPEEAVLGACKGNPSLSGPNQTATDCQIMPSGVCFLCNSFANS